MPLCVEDICLDEKPLIQRFYPLFGDQQAQTLFLALSQSLPWQRPRVRVFGKEHPVPRLQSWHGEPETTYRYSGLLLEPRAWTPELQTIRQQVEELTGQAFNSVLVNLYRDGNDCMGWHADDEPELGPRPTVASVSLGAPRDFALRRKGETRQACCISLRHNELLLMAPELQHRWQHSLPRRKKEGRARINLTFRQVRPEN